MDLDFEGATETVSRLFSVLQCLNEETRHLVRDVENGETLASHGLAYSWYLDHIAAKHREMHDVRSSVQEHQNSGAWAAISHKAETGGFSILQVFRDCETVAAVAQAILVPNLRDEHIKTRRKLPNSPLKLTQPKTKLKFMTEAELDRLKTAAWAFQRGAEENLKLMERFLNQTILLRDNITSPRGAGAGEKTNRWSGHDIEHVEQNTPKLPSSPKESAEWIAFKRVNEDIFPRAFSTMKTYRETVHGGRVSCCKTFGIDRDGNRWRQKKSGTGTTYYYKPDLKLTAEK